MSVIEDAFSAFLSTYTQLIPNDVMSEILNLRGKALDLQRDNDQLADENRQLKSKIDDLKKELEKKEAIVRKHNAYYFKEDDEKLTGPICYECYTRNGAVYVLENCNGKDCCSVCGKSYPRTIY